MNMMDLGEILMTVSVMVAVLWDVALCDLVESDLCFTGAYCLHHHPDDGRITSRLVTNLT